jgi:N-methylhydantoinase A
MVQTSPRYRLGIDVGGTFTDMLLLDETTGDLKFAKVPSTKPPEDAILAGIERFRDHDGVDPDAIVYFSHGTTLAVNTLLERNGAEVGLITTRGFRDILELRRLRLPQANDLMAPRPAPLIPRRRVVEVDGRLDAEGRETATQDRNEIVAAAGTLIAAGVANIAVAFLHAYRDDRHERRAKAWIAEAYPDVYVCTSAEIWPQQREYERTLVSVINAYIGGRMRSYFETLARRSAAIGVSTRLFSTKSNGGVMSVEAAATRPVDTLLSGPASGVIGAAFIGRQIGDDRIITLDMGGTSVDIAVIDGEVPYSNENTVGDFPVVLPAVDVSAIGAGGGSIAWIDEEGILKVGPESAGAVPGPASYGRGGSGATVTDAYVVLGVCPPSGLLGGEMPLYPECAEVAIGAIASRLGVSVREAADAILQVATANIYAGLIPQLARRGAEAADFSLLAYGAAGPTHIFMLAREIDVRRVIVPPAPGLLCALGCLVADLRADFVRSLWESASTLADERIRIIYETLSAEAQAWLDNEKVEVSDVRLIRSADICYEGQSFEVNVLLPDGPLDVATIVENFHSQYARIYGYADRSAPVRLHEARVQIVGVTRKPSLAARAEVPRQGEATPSSRRTIYEQGTTAEAQIFRRADLRPGDRFAGPAIVEQYDTTVYVPAGFSVTVDAWNNLIGDRAS